MQNQIKNKHIYVYIYIYIYIYNITKDKHIKAHKSTLISNVVQL